MFLGGETLTYDTKDIDPCDEKGKKPHKTNQQTYEMWDVRKKMAQQFAQHGNLHDPVMIQLSAQLDRLVLAEMRKHQKGRQMNEDSPPSQG